MEINPNGRGIANAFWKDSNGYTRQNDASGNIMGGATLSDNPIFNSQGQNTGWQFAPGTSGGGGIQTFNGPNQIVDSRAATPYEKITPEMKTQLGTNFQGSNSYMGGNLGMGGYQAPQATTQTSTGLGAGGSNPYLQQMGQNITAQMTDNFTRNQMPALRSGAMAAGGFGGSRQGVVEANGLKDLNLGIGQNLTNLYGTDWTNQQNRDLSYAGLDSQNAQFGANYGLNVLNAQNNWANNGVNATTQMQNTPGQYQTMFSNNQNAIAGRGQTQTNATNMQSNPWVGALGGLQMANQWLKQG